MWCYFLGYASPLWNKGGRVEDFFDSNCQHGVILGIPCLTNPLAYMYKILYFYFKEVNHCIDLDFSTGFWLWLYTTCSSKILFTYWKKVFIIYITGSLLIFYARLSFTSKRVMEVEVLADIELLMDQQLDTKRVATGYFCFLCLNDEHRVIPIPSLKVCHKCG